ncbi:SIMPL domain-containing protein [Treponema sp.]|uniref:SIMPL domain-containing protein n=1 Tax=Treponema sp. TaxID=166 RepID=UPI0025E45CEF|nr:SIMPL domain-containing protein [Treponema sp.]MCR5218298.1 SIMPL domain-containing protein [Treponema sp.]
MKRNVIVKVAASLFAFSLLFASCSKRDNRTVNVTGVGSVSFVPDMVCFSVTVKNTESRLADSLAKTKSTVSSLLEICKKYNVAAEDIKTGLVRTDKEYHWQYNTEKKVFDGYSSSQNTEITFRNIESFEAFSGEVLALDSTGIDRLSFDHSKRNEYESEANLLALDNAKESAEKICDRIGEKLGKTLCVTDSDYTDREVCMVSSADYYSKGISSGIVASPGIITVKKQINVKYQIK